MLWCVGLLTWSLRVTRSNQSKFSVKTLALITAVIAVGIVNVFPAMLFVAFAMIYDWGVNAPSKSRVHIAWRSLQFVAGATCLAHVWTNFIPTLTY